MNEKLSCNRNISKHFFEAVELQHSVLDSYHHRLLGPRFVGRKKLKKALTLFHTCLKEQEDLWFAHFLVGKIHQTLGNHLMALEHFYLTEELTTPSSYLYSEIAFSLLYKEDLDSVLEYSQNAISIEPLSIESLQYHSLFNILDNNSTTARKVLEIAYELDDSNKLTKTISGMILKFEEGKTYKPDHYELFERMPYLVPTIKTKDGWFISETFPDEVTKKKTNKKGGPFSFDF